MIARPCPRFVFALSLLILIPILAQAEEFTPVCHWTIQTTDGTTHEVRKFEPGRQSFELPLSGLAGWRNCRVSEVQKFIQEGADRIKRPSARLDIWCITEAGAAASYSATINSWSPVSFNYFTLVGEPVSFSGRGERSTIHGSGYLEIFFGCI